MSNSSETKPSTFEESMDSNPDIISFSKLNLNYSSMFLYSYFLLINKFNYKFFHIIWLVIFFQFLS